jgi:serine protease inhibitor
MKKILLLALAALGFAACGEMLGPLDELPRELTVAERTVISSANEFGLNLFGRLIAAEPSENVVFSPLSAYMALGMTSNGAVGETLAGMRSTLRQSRLTEEEANQAYRGLLDLFLGLDSGVQFDIASSIWYRLGLQVRSEFVNLSKTVFDAEVAELDFLDPSAPTTINAWVESRTNGRIRELVDELTEQDMMLLINATYFKGTWQDQFDPRQTRDLGFQLLDGSLVEVPTMTRREVEILRHQETVEFEAAELLYGRGAYVMTILLPPEGTSPTDLMAGVDAGTWGRWMDGFQETSARSVVQLPKFKLEWEKLLNDDLIAMGMGAAFHDADFSRLAEGGEDFFISKVKQKAFIEVNEEGTEAAAATSVNVAVRASPGFRATRPFIFAIRERFSGLLLFIGQLVDPSAE